VRWPPPHRGDNVRLLARMYEVWDAQDLAGVVELLDPEFEWVNPSYAVHPGIRRGHRGMEQSVNPARRQDPAHPLVPRRRRGAPGSSSRKRVRRSTCLPITAWRRYDRGASKQRPAARRRRRTWWVVQAALRTTDTGVRRASTKTLSVGRFPVYLHCPRCQTSVSAAHLISSNPVCPRCGEPATEPLSLFSSMPSRYRRKRKKPSPVARRTQDASQPLFRR
jgi:hypothetical protein